MSIRPYPRSALERGFPPIPLGWAVGREIDFTALADHTFSNGANDIGGVQFTASNSANADTFRVENGSGLEIKPKQSTQFSASTRDAPILEAKLVKYAKELAAEQQRADKFSRDAIKRDMQPCEYRSGR